MSTFLIFIIIWIGFGISSYILNWIFNTKYMLGTFKIPLIPLLIATILIVISGPIYFTLFIGDILEDNIEKIDSNFKLRKNE